MDNENTAQTATVAHSKFHHMNEEVMMSDFLIHNGADKEEMQMVTSLATLKTIRELNETFHLGTGEMFRRVRDMEQNTERILSHMRGDLDVHIRDIKSYCASTVIEAKASGLKQDKIIKNLDKITKFTDKVLEGGLIGLIFGSKKKKKVTKNKKTNKKKNA